MGMRLRGVWNLSYRVLRCQGWRNVRLCIQDMYRCLNFEVQHSSFWSTCASSYPYWIRRVIVVWKFPESWIIILYRAFQLSGSSVTVRQYLLPSEPTSLAVSKNLFVHWNSRKNIERSFWTITGRLCRDIGMKIMRFQKFRTSNRLSTGRRSGPPINQ